MDENNEIDISEFYQTPLSSLTFPAKYAKLIKRIISLNGFNNTLGEKFIAETVDDIIKLEPYKFSKYQGIGKLYIETLIEFKKELPDFLRKVKQEIEVKKLQPKVTLSTEQLETPLNALVLSSQHQKLIKRISNIVGDVNTVQDIINIKPISFSELPTVGKLYVNNLIELQKVLPELLEKNTQKTAFFKENYSIDFNEIDNILIEDIENYLWTLDEKRMDVALSRWGFNQQHETLEEVGKRYNLTRERIRQFEKTINANLILSLRIEPKVLWANIREKMTEDLAILLPNLAKCFDTGRLFYEFIALCCQVESGSIHKIVFTKINPKIIHQLFCTNQSPIELEVIINELVSNYGYSKAAAINGIKELKQRDKIEITEQGIYPKNLGKIEATAHVLTFHPAGLPWKDIARIVNKQGYSSTPFNEKIQASGSFINEFIYLSNHGTYRNLMFLDIEQFDISKIMQSLLDYFKKNQLTVLHLHDYYYQTKNQRDEIEYFTLRHLVREYGEEYGLYFNGKSGSDSVSIDSEIKNFTQADVIIKVLNESKVAMTMQEIAERLRSKSTRHANFYIHNLMEEGKVVRVDKMVYTTTEKAFSNINTKAIMQVIKDIMNVPNAIVEADIFREYINMELNLSYSKYIYASLVKTQLKEIKWYCNNTLFSKRTIPYKNLADVCRQLCNPTLSNNENIKIIQKAIWLTDSVAMSIIQSWRLV